MTTPSVALHTHANVICIQCKAACRRAFTAGAVSVTMGTSAQPVAAQKVWGAAQLARSSRTDSLIQARKFNEVAPLLLAAVADDSLNFRATFLLAQIAGIVERNDVAIPAYLRAWQLGNGRRTLSALFLAHASAKAGDRRTTLAWLDSALSLRLTPRQQIAGDTTFAFLSNDPDFRRIAGLPPTAAVSRDERWRYDIGYFRTEAQRLHASPSREAFSPVFDDAVNALLASVSTQSDEQPFVGLRRLAATLNDGHTHVLRADAKEPLLNLPLYLFGDELYVVGAVQGRSEISWGAGCSRSEA